jgi:predicted NBD/HSP70 family sugar kinase
MTTLPLGNRDLIRAINRSIILTVIKNHGSIGRAEVARITGLSPATITGSTGDLIDEGLIFEKQPGDSSGGRPPILLALNPRGGYVVGVKLMEDHAAGALTDLEATVLVKGSAELACRTPECAVETLVGLVQSLLNEADLPPDRLMGVGIGLAGIVDSQSGLLRKSPFFGWKDLPLRDLLQERLHTPVVIDNDVNTLTLAERLYGSGQGVGHFLALTVGRGIGLGIVINGQVYRGVGGGAGEFGHTVIDPDGPVCDCGKRGCLEAYVGDPGLMRQAAEARQRGELPETADTDGLLALAQAGQPAARAIFAQAGKRLGLAVANLINLLNPQRVLISGEGVRYGNWMFEPMRAAIRSYALPTLLQDADIRIDPWGDDVWARGAASLVLRQLFDAPVHALSIAPEGN